MEAHTANTSPISRDLEFLGLQTPEFRDSYDTYVSMSSSGSSQKDILGAIASKMASSYGIPEKAAAKMASIAVRSFSDPAFPALFADCAPTGPSPDPAGHAHILRSDAMAFRDLTAADPHSSFELRCLLMSLLVNYRRNWHPKGWVRYDRRAIMHMAGLSLSSQKTKEELTSYLHREYGMEMQVVGSNSPMPCYMFAWAKSHAESPSNPRIDLGPYEPASVFAAVSRFGGPIPPDPDPAAQGAARKTE